MLPCSQTMVMKGSSTQIDASFVACLEPALADKLIVLASRASNAKKTFSFQS